MTADLRSGTWATIRDRPDAAATGPTRVMEVLAQFHADPCASTWYNFVVRLGLLAHSSEVHGILGDLDPYPRVTALALADARLARDAGAEHDPD